MTGPVSVLRPRLLAALLAVAAATVGVGAGPATAQPAPAPAPGTALAWPQLGLPASVQLDTAAAKDFTVPVPHGTRSVVLTGRVRAPEHPGAGRVEITGGNGTPVADIALPDGTAGTAAAFSVDLSALPVVDDAVTFGMRLRQQGTSADRCAPPSDVTLFDLAATFAVGDVEVPRTVQSFLPPVLTALTVQVPEHPTVAEQQAALDLVTAVTARYRPVPVDVRVVASAPGSAGPPVTDDPLQRTVVVTEGGDAAATVESADGRAYLAITGPAPTLAAQTALFATGTDALAQSSTVSVTDAAARTVHGSDTLTFDQLGAAAQADVLGRTDTYLGFEPTAFGSAQLGAAQVHLLADYTPVHPEDSATLVVEAAGTVVQSLRLDESGHVDRTFELPTRMPGRATGMTLQLTYTPHGGCTPYTAPLSFRTDPRSTVTVAADGDPRGGFAALPLAFVPSVQVALDDSNPGNLARAAAVLRSVQRLTAVPLNVEVVPLEQAAGSGSGAVVVADAATVAALELDPPLSGTGEQVTADVVAPLSATVPGGLGSVQAFTDGGRSLVLVTASGDWTPVDRLLDYAAGLEQGWASLTGDVLVAGADGRPAALTVRTDGSARFLAETPSSWRRWAWLGVAAALVLAVGVSVERLRRRRGARSRGHSDD